MFTYIKIYLPKIILCILLFLTALSIYLYAVGDLNDRFTPFIGSFLSGIVLVIVQFLLTWYEHTSISYIHSLKIKDILLHRDDRNFYYELIKNSKEEISILGVTAQRFMEHFADDSENSRPEAKVLLEALSRGVKVRILVPEKQFLRDGSDRSKFDLASKRLSATKNHFNNFNYSYFNHEPAHSIFIVDDNCIIGPVLPGVASKNTPAIYMDNSSPYAKKYLEYFENEWNEASA